MGLFLVVVLTFFSSVRSTYNYLSINAHHILKNPVLAYPYTAPERVLSHLNNTNYKNDQLQDTLMDLLPSVGYIPSNVLQVVHPPAPNEKHWVMTTGNETLVDDVLAISLNYGGRLVSIGYFTKDGAVNYYAIMHKYTGPVFIKPKPMTFDELIKSVRENELRDLALTQVCGQEEKHGQLMFNTYWEKVPGIKTHVWFPGTRHAETQRKHFEENGFRLTYLCGYSVAGKGR
uniref:Secreted protein n=1 Tax=Heterorhabditis bacteriophora TaxID=37862 RepID=A0A1I7XJL8_HETBA